MEKIKIVLYDGFMPERQHEGDAGYDLRVPQDIVLKQGRQVIDLGFAIELPHGLAATVQPRSGFSCKGMEVVDRRGCDETRRIDADVIRGLVDEGYRNHVGVILNVREPNAQNFMLPKGTRIAQMQIVAVPETEFEQVEELSDGDRGMGGFGHTGTK